MTSAIACKVETGRALAVAGLHPATGGSGLELCSGDMLLEALVACAGVTLKAVATALAFRLDGATVTAEGDLDFRGTLGVAKDAPVGFKAIRLAFQLAHGRASGAYRCAAEADRALLRGVPDAQPAAGTDCYGKHNLSRFRKSVSRLSDRNLRQNKRLSRRAWAKPRKSA